MLRDRHFVVDGLCEQTGVAAATHLTTIQGLLPAAPTVGAEQLLRAIGLLGVGDDPGEMRCHLEGAWVDHRLAYYLTHREAYLLRHVRTARGSSRTSAHATCRPTDLRMV